MSDRKKFNDLMRSFQPTDVDALPPTLPFEDYPDVDLVAFDMEEELADKIAAIAKAKAIAKDKAA